MAAFCRKPRLLASQKTIFFSTLSSSTSPFSSFRALKSAIQSESDTVKLAEIFQSSADLGCFYRHRPLFHLSIRKLARSQRFDLIDRILEHQLKTNVKHSCSEGFWIRIIMLYSSAGMIDHAVRTFNQMGLCNCPRTEKSLCAVLSVHLNNQMYDKIHEIFESVPSKTGISPGVKSSNLVLKAFCEEKRVESAREWLGKIENEAEVVPNIDSYNILLGAYSKVGNNVEFDGVVKEILKKGLEPNLTTYNHRILRLCKNKECVRAKKLLDEMVSKGVKPNSATYDSLIFGFCNVGDLESARKVLEGMVGDGYVSPPCSSYYILLRHMVEEGEFDSALEICKEIIKRKWVPQFDVMQGLVSGLVERSKLDEAKDVVKKMKNRLRGTAVDSWGAIEATLPL